MTITRTEVTHPSYGGTLTLYYVESAPVVGMGVGVATGMGVGVGVGVAGVVGVASLVSAAGYGVTYSREAGR